MVAVVSLLTIAGGTLSIVAQLRGSDSGNVPQPTPTTQALAVPTATPAATTSDDATPTNVQGEPVIEPPPIAEVAVGQPEMLYHTSGGSRVAQEYDECHPYDWVQVCWPAGSFPEERAREVVQATFVAFDVANGMLNTNDYDPVTVYLSPQLFADDCVGCQGFAAADLRQIFLLQDGSLAADEFQALLVHEVAHVIAAAKLYLPLELFHAEGLATWVMTDDFVQAGYVSPTQTAAWAYRAGAMPSLFELLEDDFAGRMRKRVYYDGAASFVTFFVETYGWPAYRRLYTLDPPDMIIGKDWATLEGEWHAYLEQVADNEINGTDGYEWWAAAQRVIDGYAVLYEDPSLVTPEQYAALVSARLALNRAELDLAIAQIEASGLAPQTAQ
jgi:hypothetical protein